MGCPLPSISMMPTGTPVARVYSTANIYPSAENRATGSASVRVHVSPLCSSAQTSTVPRVTPVFCDSEL